MQASRDARALPDGGGAPPSASAPLAGASPGSAALAREAKPRSPAIDVMRGVCATLVVLHHIHLRFRFNRFDVREMVPRPLGTVLFDTGHYSVVGFLVISGFLITRIIATDIEKGRFSLRWFYVRRIRRILPVFYTVTLVTMLAGYVLLLPADLHAFLSSVRHAVLFAANIYFSKDQGYFDISADEKPMLHIWSLSIEEQYYFIWPLLLLLFMRRGT